MRYFFSKFYPPRSDFIQTMTESEAKLFKEHGAYMQELLAQNKVVAHGPVIDPAGGFGMSLFEVEDENEVTELTSKDPMILANIGARYEKFPMIQLRFRK